MPNTPTKPNLPRGIWVLGFVSMLMDISSEMIHSILPLYMLSVLGSSVFAIGLLEGLAESLALIVKIFSGTLSDYFGKRKPLAVLGYTMGAASKPLFAISTSFGGVMSARFLDRIGKGIRGAPRDALVADLAPPSIRGAAFGLRQSLDTIGAFTGPIMAVLLLLIYNNNFRLLFWIAVIPGVLSVLLLIIGVKEPHTTAVAKRSVSISKANLKRLNSQFWWIATIGGFFTLARFSEAFLVLRAQQSGIATALIPLVIVAMNATYAVSAYPFGKISDSMNHTQLLAWGLITLICADLILAFSTDLTFVCSGIVLWGLHMGITQGLLATMVANNVPSDLRGTAFGFFNLVCGLAMLVASVLAGIVWDRLGASFTFIVGAGFCVLALLGIWLRPISSNA